MSTGLKTSAEHSPIIIYSESRRVTRICCKDFISLAWVSQLQGTMAQSEQLTGFSSASPNL